MDSDGGAASLGEFYFTVGIGSPLEPIDKESRNARDLLTSRFAPTVLDFCPDRDSLDMPFRELEEAILAFFPLQELSFVDLSESRPPSFFNFALGGPPIRFIGCLVVYEPCIPAKAVQTAKGVRQAPTVGEFLDAQAAFWAAPQPYLPMPLRSNNAKTTLLIGAPRILCVMSRVPVLRVMRSFLFELYSVCQAEAITWVLRRKRQLQMGQCGPKCCMRRQHWKVRRAACPSYERLIALLLFDIPMFTSPGSSGDMVGAGGSADESSRTVHGGVALQPEVEGMSAVVAKAGSRVIWAQSGHPVLCSSSLSCRPLFMTMTPDMVAEVVSLLLLENKVVFISEEPALAAHMCQLIKEIAIPPPFSWPHPFIPLLPYAKRAHLQAPIPFLYGMAATEKIRMGLDWVFVVDLDARKIIPPRRALDRDRPVIPPAIQEELSRLRSLFVPAGRTGDERRADFRASFSSADPDSRAAAVTPTEGRADRESLWTPTGKAAADLRGGLRWSDARTPQWPPAASSTFMPQAQPSPPLPTAPNQGGRLHTPSLAPKRDPSLSSVSTPTSPSRSQVNRTISSASILTEQRGDNATQVGGSSAPPPTVPRPAASSPPDSHHALAGSLPSAAPKTKRGLDEASSFSERGERDGNTRAGVSVPPFAFNAAPSTPSTVGLQPASRDSLAQPGPASRGSRAAGDPATGDAVRPAGPGLSGPVDTTAHRPLINHDFTHTASPPVSPPEDSLCAQAGEGEGRAEGQRGEAEESQSESVAPTTDSPPTDGGVLERVDEEFGDGGEEEEEGNDPGVPPPIPTAPLRPVPLGEGEGAAAAEQQPVVVDEAPGSEIGEEDRGRGERSRERVSSPSSVASAATGQSFPSLPLDTEGGAGSGGTAVVLEEGTHGQPPGSPSGSDDETVAAGGGGRTGRESPGGAGSDNDRERERADDKCLDPLVAATGGPEVSRSFGHLSSSSNVHDDLQRPSADTGAPSEPFGPSSPVSPVNMDPSPQVGVGGVGKEMSGDAQGGSDDPSHGHGMRRRRTSLQSLLSDGQRDPESLPPNSYMHMPGGRASHLPQTSKSMDEVKGPDGRNEEELNGAVEKPGETSSALEGQCSTPPPLPSVERDPHQSEVRVTAQSDTSPPVHPVEDPSPLRVSPFPSPSSIPSTRSPTEPVDVVSLRDLRGRQLEETAAAERPSPSNAQAPSLTGASPRSTPPVPSLVPFTERAPLPAVFLTAPSKLITGPSQTHAAAESREREAPVPEQTTSLHPQQRREIGRRVGGVRGWTPKMLLHPHGAVRPLRLLRENRKLQMAKSDPPHAVPQSSRSPSVASPPEEGTHDPFVSSPLSAQGSGEPVLAEGRGGGFASGPEGSLPSSSASFQGDMAAKGHTQTNTQVPVETSDSVSLVSGGAPASLLLSQPSGIPSEALDGRDLRERPLHEGTEGNMWRDTVSALQCAMLRIFGNYRTYLRIKYSNPSTGGRPQSAPPPPAADPSKGRTSSPAPTQSSRTPSRPASPAAASPSPSPHGGASARGLAGRGAGSAVGGSTSQQQQGKASPGLQPHSAGEMTVDFDKEGFLKEFERDNITQLFLHRLFNTTLWYLFLETHTLEREADTPKRTSASPPEIPLGKRTSGRAAPVDLKAGTAAAASGGKEPPQAFLRPRSVAGRLFCDICDHAQSRSIRRGSSSFSHRRGDDFTDSREAIRAAISSFSQVQRVVLCPSPLPAHLDPLVHPSLVCACECCRLGTSFAPHISEGQVASLKVPLPLLRAECFPYSRITNRRPLTERANPLKAPRRTPEPGTLVRDPSGKHSRAYPPAKRRRLLTAGDEQRSFEPLSAEEVAEPEIRFTPAGTLNRPPPPVLASSSAVELRCVETGGEPGKARLILVNSELIRDGAGGSAAMGGKNAGGVQTNGSVRRSSKSSGRQGVVGRAPCVNMAFLLWQTVVGTRSVLPLLPDFQFHPVLKGALRRGNEGRGRADSEAGRRALSPDSSGGGSRKAQQQQQQKVVKGTRRSEKEPEGARHSSRQVDGEREDESRKDEIVQKIVERVTAAGLLRGVLRTLSSLGRGGETSEKDSHAVSADGKTSEKSARPEGGGGADGNETDLRWHGSHGVAPEGFGLLLRDTTLSDLGVSLRVSGLLEGVSDCAATCSNPSCLAVRLLWEVSTAFLGESATPHTCELCGATNTELSFFLTLSRSETSRHVTCPPLPTCLAELGSRMHLAPPSPIIPLLSPQRSASSLPLQAHHPGGPFAPGSPRTNFQTDGGGVGGLEENRTGMQIGRRASEGSRTHKPRGPLMFLRARSEMMVAGVPPDKDRDFPSNEMLAAVNPQIFWSLVLFFSLRVEALREGKLLASWPMHFLCRRFLSEVAGPAPLPLECPLLPVALPPPAAPGAPLSPPEAAGTSVPLPSPAAGAEESKAAPSLSPETPDAPAIPAPPSGGRPISNAVRGQHRMGTGSRGLSEPPLWSLVVHAERGGGGSGAGSSSSATGARTRLSRQGTSSSGLEFSPFLGSFLPRGKSIHSVTIGGGGGSSVNSQTRQGRRRSRPIRSVPAIHFRAARAMEEQFRALAEGLERDRGDSRSCSRSPTSRPTKAERERGEMGSPLPGGSGGSGGAWLEEMDVPDGAGDATLLSGEGADRFWEAGGGTMSGRSPATTALLSRSQMARIHSQHSRTWGDEGDQRGERGGSSRFHAQTYGMGEEMESQREGRRSGGRKSGGKKNRGSKGRQQKESGKVPCLSIDLHTAMTEDHLEGERGESKSSHQNSSTRRLRPSPSGLRDRSKRSAAEGAEKATRSLEASSVRRLSGVQPGGSSSFREKRTGTASGTGDTFFLSSDNLGGMHMGRKGRGDRPSQEHAASSSRALHWSRSTMLSSTKGSPSSFPNPKRSGGGRRSQGVSAEWYTAEVLGGQSGKEKKGGLRKAAKKRIKRRRRASSVFLKPRTEREKRESPKTYDDRDFREDSSDSSLIEQQQQQREEGKQQHAGISTLSALQDATVSNSRDGELSHTTVRRWGTEEYAGGDHSASLARGVQNSPRPAADRRVGVKKNKTFHSSRSALQGSASVSRGASSTLRAGDGKKGKVGGRGKEGLIGDRRQPRDGRKGVDVAKSVPKKKKKKVISAHAGGKKVTLSPQRPRMPLQDPPRRERRQVEERRVERGRREASRTGGGRRAVVTQVDLSTSSLGVPRRGTVARAGSTASERPEASLTHTTRLPERYLKPPCDQRMSQSRPASLAASSPPTVLDTLPTSLDPPLPRQSPASSSSRPPPSTIETFAHRGTRQAPEVLPVVRQRQWGGARSAAAEESSSLHTQPVLSRSFADAPRPSATIVAPRPATSQSQYAPSPSPSPPHAPLTTTRFADAVEGELSPGLKRGGGGAPSGWGGSSVSVSASVERNSRTPSPEPEPSISLTPSVTAPGRVPHNSNSNSCTQEAPVSVGQALSALQRRMDPGSPLDDAGARGPPSRRLDGGLVNLSRESDPPFLQEEPCDSFRESRETAASSDVHPPSAVRRRDARGIAGGGGRNSAARLPCEPVRLRQQEKKREKEEGRSRGPPPTSSVRLQQGSSSGQRGRGVSQAEWQQERRRGDGQTAGPPRAAQNPPSSSSLSASGDVRRSHGGGSHRSTRGLTSVSGSPAPPPSRRQLGSSSPLPPHAVASPLRARDVLDAVASEMLPSPSSPSSRSQRYR